MKKYYFLLVAIMMAMVSIGLTACGDDEDEPKFSDIIGTWKMTGAQNGANYIILQQFTKDGKSYDVEILTMDGVTEVEVWRGTYSINQVVISIDERNDAGDNRAFNLKYQIKGKQLILSDAVKSYEFTQVSDSEIEKYL